jgi:hypothetical protein
MKILKKLILIIYLITAQQSLAEEQNYCNITDEIREKVLQQVKNQNPEAIKSLPQCFKLDRRLILKASLIDISQFDYADQILKEDENFVSRLLKINPNVLKYAGKNLLSDKIFMENATYISRDSLKYADPKLTDNKLFIKRMIEIDSRNYIFASERLKEIPQFAQMAFEDDGMLLLYAPEKIRSNKDLVKIAFKSNNLSIQYAAEELRNHKEFVVKSKGLTKISNEELTDFLNKNYVTKENSKNFGIRISNKAKFFSKNNIIDRNYITKWQQISNYSSEISDDNLNLLAAESRNYQISWKKDLAKYPDLVKKIEKFFQNHKIDQNTIDNFSLTYLWKIKNKPTTLAFNLYLLRENSDYDLGPSFSDISSLTAIVQKIDNKWEMTVVEVIFDSEVEVKIDYKNGHKKYILWDLYKSSKKDPNPKVIFKVEDRFDEYFEIFYEENHGKYELIYRIKIHS